jgi:hypothetical protein
VEISINFLAVILAALSTMVVDSVWYSSKVMGKTWTELTNAKQDANITTKQAFVMYGGTFVASLVTAYVLAYASFVSFQYFHASFVVETLRMGILLWLGFTAARIYTHDTFEGRRKKLTALIAAHELVIILVMALIIGFMGLPQPPR